MELDPIYRLSKKIKFIQDKRDNVERQITNDRKEVDEIESRLAELREKLESMKTVSGKGEEKSNRIDKLIEDTEKTLRKIVETSLTLERALDEEIIGP